MAPNKVPTPAVIAMASAPQKVTRKAARVIGAPPAPAPNPPKIARNTSEVPATKGMSSVVSAMRTANSGSANDQTRGGYDPVVRAQHGGTKPADALRSMPFSVECRHAQIPLTSGVACSRIHQPCTVLLGSTVRVKRPKASSSCGWFVFQGLPAPPQETQENSRHTLTNRLYYVSCGGTRAVDNVGFELTMESRHATHNRLAGPGCPPTLGEFTLRGAM